MLQFVRRLWYAIRRRRFETDLADEIEFHRVMKQRELEERGLEPRAATFATRRALGSVALAEDRARDIWRPPWLQGIGQDVRIAVRALGTTPIVNAVAILSLALGIGANTAIFSLVNSLMLRTLPVDRPERLAILLQDNGAGAWSHPIWEAVRDRSAPFDGALAWGTQGFDLAQGGEAQPVEGVWVSGGFFEALGVRPVLGRTFGPDDDRRGGGADGAVAVISYSFWQRRFGGGADAIGRQITLDRVPFTIVGVAPAAFFGLDVGRAFDVMVPIGTEALVRGDRSQLDQPLGRWLSIMVRLKPDQTIEAAGALIRGLQPQIREATLPDEADVGYLATPLTLAPAATGRSLLRTRYARPLLTLFVIVGLVLLIACANIANLLLARALARRHELAVRLALGAPAWRLARQLLTESVVLASAGAVVGLLFAEWGTRLLVSQLSTAGDAVFLDLAMDGRVLGFTTAVTVLMALVFGTAPALTAGRTAPDSALKSRKTGEDKRRIGLGSGLVVAQVALSLVLVFVAGLFVRTFVTLATMDVGFVSDRLLVVNVQAPQTRFAGTDLRPLFDQVHAAAAQVPGVADAVMSRMTPIDGNFWRVPVRVQDGADLPLMERIANINAITPRWLSTLGMRLLAGRDFTEADRAGSLSVAIINEEFARHFDLGPNPVGRVVFQEGPFSGPPLQVVGLAADARYRSVRDPAQPALYLPMAQQTQANSSVRLILRAASGRPILLTKSVGAAISDVNRDLVLTFRPLSDYVSASILQERLLAIMSGFFGGLALLLAALGLYGVTSYAVSRRRAEIGIRMALGAERGRVVRLVLSRVAGLVGVGMAIGLAVTLYASTFVGTLLYGLEPRDPATLVGSVLVLAGVGAVAGWLPAWRASRIDPAAALRNE